MAYRRRRMRQGFALSSSRREVISQSLACSATSVRSQSLPESAKPARGLAPWRIGIRRRKAAANRVDADLHLVERPRSCSAV
jgi:hypothetical protein